ncbi:MAG TPA: NADH-quinone oxidoreductase subunit N [Phycisphaerae bacterium]|nr:NADH-quinone oxidoreductase subunit N [Phycisphaerae bacterium]HRY67986.1 NADH-quinone oxidoreductase subunit N [Phycisphaerae bacterium]HSA26723.1 NADH-quinone oxidoreductase subunit N [Phycisphaerae bacterium]
MTCCFSILAPEMLLLVAAGLVLLAGVSGSMRLRAGPPWIAMAAVAAAIWLSLQPCASGGADLPGIRVSALTWYARIAGLSVGLLVMLAHLHLPLPGEKGEHFAMMLFALAGLTLVASADDLITLFLALELVSVPTYVLVAASGRDVRAHEAGMKYFFLGSLAASVLVYGFSFLYGASGTCRLSGMAGVLDAHDPLVLIGMVLAMMGLAYKLAVVPFHLYAPDVYQGAASPVTALLGFLPKLAGFVALVKLLALIAPAGGTSAEVWCPPAGLFWLLWFLAAATMTVGNCQALWQGNVKRMLACSSMAHSGYLLVAVLAGPAGGGGPLDDGWSAMLFYAIVYGVLNLGVFAVLGYLRAGSKAAEDLEDLAGLARRFPAPALVMALCLFGLMGMPPTAGFLGKVLIFGSALSAGAGHPHQGAMILLVVIGVLNAAVAAVYYLRVIGACYLSAPQGELSFEAERSQRLGLLACAVVVLLLGLRPHLLLQPAQDGAAAVSPSRSCPTAVFAVSGAPPEDLARPETVCTLRSEAPYNGPP